MREDVQWMGRKPGNQNRTKTGILVVVSVLFYAGMLVLALGARRLHESSLPRVDVVKPEIIVFGAGETWKVSSALPEEMVTDGTLFVVSQELVNGEIRMVARKVADLLLGQTEDGYREIIRGVDAMSQVIVDAGEELSDGDEVLLKEERADEGD